ncbi:MAG TPA: phospho-N-acetylmuramoyl-pentapeptide-transferase [Phototrophicaceae bacterium]|jgi:phospho-N-acetylmuramoyl-pentapeptide-transferase|nr:phospho-N-acetylmuramoyl-pentapeptide-transferase [Phototrophicaceae bacterium]
MNGAPLPFALSLGGIAFLLGVIWGGPFIEILRRLKLGKNIRVELHENHQKKRGTPTMGGIMIVMPTLALLVSINLARVVQTGEGASIFLPLIVMFGFGILGLLDDWAGIQKSRGIEGEGLSARTKSIVQFILAGGAALVISFYGGGFSYANEILVPLLGIKVHISPILFIPITIFLILATSNGVNFTDGLDGLAGIISASAFAAYGIISFIQGQYVLTQLCFVLVGACFAFLWFNANPAQLFMGDTGSMALGSALGIVAVMTGQWLLLPIIAVVPMAETISVILQVYYFRWTKGQRLFRQAPIHHHFELSGWSETQIVQRFWLIGLLSAMIGVALALL